MTTKYDSDEYLAKVHEWWSAANYISVGQIFLKENPLLTRPLVNTDIKRKPIGHWGTIPAGNFVYAHLNRVINKYNLNMFYLVGPGHGGPVMNTNAYLDGSYTQLYPELTRDLEGMQKFFKQFSFPGGIGSHAAPETPGSIHEGGELGYSLSHAVGAILDNPDLIAVPFIGDGESETGPLTTSWFANTFINPVNDGAVLPIINLNGAKISNPTILSRKSDEELTEYYRGMGWYPLFVEGDDPDKMHRLMAKTLDHAIEIIRDIQMNARAQSADSAVMGHWPVIVLRTPKGWTGPEKVDGKQLVGSFRAHQIPLPVSEYDTSTIDILETWMRSYHPEKLFTSEGRLRDDLLEIAPPDNLKMSLNPVTSGHSGSPALDLPDWTKYSQSIEIPGGSNAQDMIEFGGYIRDLIKSNPSSFRIFGPDETASNRLQKIFETTNRQWLEPTNPLTDEFVAPAGRVIDSQLSEHQNQGFLEGYVLTGRHGFYASYESFVRITDSMLTQHFKWLRKSSEISWRKPIPSLNIIAVSTVFQQDHNGYTHQDPGVVTHLAEKTPEFIREYFPADTNSLLATMDKVFKSEHKINVIVASKQVRPQFFTVAESKTLVETGYKVIDWASTVGENEAPDVVIVSCGTEPTIEALATVNVLHDQYPEMKIRFVNVVDLLKLRHPDVDPRGIDDETFNHIFTVDKPIIFAFHAYEGLIRDIFYKRTNRNLHIHGYREEGDITTPFDMRVMSEMDRFHMAREAAILVYGNEAQAFVDKLETTLAYHTQYTQEYGSDIPEVENWKWTPLTASK